MKKIIILSILACLPVHSYGISNPLDLCRRSYTTCPIDPTKNTHMVWNGKTETYNTIYNGNPTIQLPFAFATEDYKHLLKVDNDSCYVCGGTNCGTQTVVSIIKDGRIVDFYGCLLDHSISTDLGFYRPSSSGWRRIDDKINNIKQCPESNLFRITKKPKEHGGKAYYLGSGDGKSYTYTDGNGVISLYALENNSCYYYYCDDGYNYSLDEETCITKQEILSIISEMEKAVKTAKDLTPEQKTQYQSKIKLLKQKFGLE